MKKHLPIFFSMLILIQLGSGVNSFAQSKADKIDALMRQYYEYGQFNGSILVAENGKIIFKKGYGLANMEWEIPNAPDTKFRLGSITKQFTATLIMQHVEQGKLKLDGRITDYLPDYPAATGNKVTMHNLLSHTSGIPNYTALPFFREIERKRMRADDLIRTFCDSALQFEPGTNYSYSNSNYILLGAVIQKITGKPYEQVLAENILIPLDMKNTGYDHSEPLLKKRAQGYEKNFTNYRNADFLDLSIPFAAGALYSTVEDLYLWDQALYTEKLVSGKSKEILFRGKIQTLDGLEYAYGWGVGKLPIGNLKDSVAVHFHGGGINGFNTLITRVPADRNLVLLLNNTGEAQLLEMNRAILGIVYGKSYDPPKKSLAENLMKTITESNIESALKEFHALKTKQPDKYFISEIEMNALGYILMGEKRIKEAIEVFKLNVENFPQAWNVYDSLGEAYLENGDKELAKKNYDKSVALNPNNANGKEILNKLNSK